MRRSFLKIATALLSLMASSARSQSTSSADDSSSTLAQPANHHEQSITTIEPAERFAHPREDYAFLVYKEAVQENRGLGSQEMKQPLPVEGTTLLAATPKDKSLPMASDRHGVWQRYPLLRRSKSIVHRENSVFLADIETNQEAMLIEGPDVSASRFSEKFIRTALSPDGNRLAAALLRNDNENETSLFPSYDIYVIDVDVPVLAFPKPWSDLQSSESYRPRLIREAIRGDSTMGSSVFLNAVAPPIFWADNKTLLIATPNRRSIKSQFSTLHIDDQQSQFELSKYPDQIVMQNGKLLTPTHDVLAVNVDDLAEQHICEAKIVNSLFGATADFWRRSDGQLMLRSRGGDYRIDLGSKQAIEDRHLSPLYEFRSDTRNPELWFGEECLCRKLAPCNVSVAPDGRSIAWYARSELLLDQTNLGNTSQYLTVLWYHSPETGKVRITEGKFDNGQPSMKFDNPELNKCIQWLTSDAK